jgi:hypothetical protein
MRQYAPTFRADAPANTPTHPHAHTPMRPCASMPTRAPTHQCTHTPTRPCDHIPTCQHARANVPTCPATRRRADTLTRRHTHCLRVHMPMRMCQCANVACRCRCPCHAFYDLGAQSPFLSLFFSYIVQHHNVYIIRAVHETEFKK